MTLLEAASSGRRFRLQGTGPWLEPGSSMPISLLDAIKDSWETEELVKALKPTELKAAWERARRKLDFPDNHFSSILSSESLVFDCFY